MKSEPVKQNLKFSSYCILKSCIYYHTSVLDSPFTNGGFTKVYDNIRKCQFYDMRKNRHTGGVYKDSSKPDAVVETSVIHQYQGCEAHITIIHIKK